MKRFILICCTIMLFFFSVISAQAENPGVPWAEIPREIVDALDDSLRDLAPSRHIRIEEKDEDKAALLLDSGEEFGTLCVFEKDDAGKWRLIGINDRIVEMSYLDMETPVSWWAGSFTVYANALHADDTAGAIHWSFEKTPDGADLTLQNHIDINFTELGIAYVVYPHMGGYSVGRISYREGSDQYDRSLVFGIPSASFEKFDAADFYAFVVETLSAQNDPPEMPLAQEENPLPPPQELSLSFGAISAIFTGPSESYSQTNGKESGAKEWAQVFGIDGEYAFVQYNVGKEQNRFGYIPLAELPDAIDISDLSWANEPCVTTISLSLMDDPLRSRHAVGVLPAGTSVTKLATFGEAFSYVEAEIEGKPARGFVLSSFVVPEADAPEEADEARALTTYFFDRYGDTPNMNLWLQNELSPTLALSEDKLKALEAEQFDALLKALPLFMEQGVTAEMLVNEYTIRIEYGDPYTSSGAWYLSASGSRFIPEPMNVIFMTLEEGTYELLFLQVGGNG